jgi:hypothetical protein
MCYPFLFGILADPIGFISMGWDVESARAGRAPAGDRMSSCGLRKRLEKLEKSGDYSVNGVPPDFWGALADSVISKPRT